MAGIGDKREWIWRQPSNELDEHKSRIQSNTNKEQPADTIKVSLMMVVVMIVIVMTVGHITKVWQELVQQVFIWELKGDKDKGRYGNTETK